ncbi:MAG: SagB/ThcOx family dehydrogenase [Nitrospinae bacterium]|nr:SagB/ThcOx family dehydrogenase [Nitrospinota bacterium]
MKATPENAGALFMELTKFENLEGPSDMALGVKIPDPEYRHPGAGPAISLPGPDLALLDARPFSSMLQGRRSRRDFSKEQLPLEELSVLLYSTQGVMERTAYYHLRTVPSAGARHPLETFLCVNRVTGLEPGLYHYLPFSNAVEAVRTDKGEGEKWKDVCLGQEMVEDSAVDFIWTAVFYRAGWKYKQRGFRYIHLDAGHACQNLYLACEALGLGCCALAAFDDNGCARLLGVDGKEQFCLYMASVGKLPAPRHR